MAAVNWLEQKIFLRWARYLTSVERIFPTGTRNQRAVQHVWRFVIFGQLASDFLAERHMHAALQRAFRKSDLAQH